MIKAKNGKAFVATRKDRALSLVVGSEQEGREVWVLAYISLDGVPRVSNRGDRDAAVVAVRSLTEQGAGAVQAFRFSGGRMSPALVGVLDDSGKVPQVREVCGGCGGWHLVNDRGEVACDGEGASTVHLLAGGNVNKPTSGNVDVAASVDVDVAASVDVDKPKARRTRRTAAA